MPSFSVYLKLLTATGLVSSTALIPFGVLYAVLVNESNLFNIFLTEIISGLLLGVSISCAFFVSALISYLPLKKLVENGFLNLLDQKADGM